VVTGELEEIWVSYWLVTNFCGQTCSKIALKSDFFGWKSNIFLPKPQFWALAFRSGCPHKRPPITALLSCRGIFGVFSNYLIPVQMSAKNDIFVVQFAISVLKNKEQAAIDVLHTGNSLNIQRHGKRHRTKPNFIFLVCKLFSINQIERNDRTGAKMSVDILGVGDRPSPTRI